MRFCFFLYHTFVHNFWRVNRNVRNTGYIQYNLISSIEEKNKHVYRYISMIFLINMQLFQIKVNVENSRRNKIFLQNVAFQSYKVKEKNNNKTLTYNYSFIYEFRHITCLSILFPWLKQIQQYIIFSIVK